MSTVILCLFLSASVPHFFHSEVFACGDVNKTMAGKTACRRGPKRARHTVNSCCLELVFIYHYVSTATDSKTFGKSERIKQMLLKCSLTKIFLCLLNVYDTDTMTTNYSLVSHLRPTLTPNNILTQSIMHFHILFSP